MFRPNKGESDIFMLKKLAGLLKEKLFHVRYVKFNASRSGVQLWAK